MLSGMGFSEVYNLKGGIKGWRGVKATGPESLNMDIVLGFETPAEIISVAYSMEMALQKFHSEMFKRAENQEVKELFSKLSDIEEKHKDRLLSAYADRVDSEISKDKFESEIVSKLMEGGFNVDEYIEKNEKYTDSIFKVVNLSMMIEAQALDLYLRFTKKISDKDSKEVLHSIAEEEKEHLASLGKLLEKNL